MNRKGFMMAEVVVVSAIILSFLAGIFISYNKIYTAYTKRLNYYNTVALYRLGFYQDYYRNELGTLSNNAKREATKLDEISSIMYNENVFMIYNNNMNLVSTVLDNKNVNKTYKEYIDYLASSVDLTKTSYVMILERCQKKIDEYEKDQCQYAYLEVPNEP